MIDVDSALISASAVIAARQVRDEVMRDYGAEVGQLRAELDQDRDRRELAALRYEILDAPRRVAERAAILNDPRTELLAELGRVSVEVLHPELMAAAAAYRAERVAEREAQAAEAIVASALRYGHSGRGTSPADRLRRWAAKGSTKAADLLAEVVQHQGRRTNTAIVASGYRPQWKITETREGHKRAEWSVFRPDGRVTQHVRWRPYGTTTWLTPAQFADRKRRAEQRKRALKRMSYAVGSARR